LPVGGIDPSPTEVAHWKKNGEQPHPEQHLHFNLLGCCTTPVISIPPFQQNPKRNKKKEVTQYGNHPAYRMPLSERTNDPPYPQDMGSYRQKEDKDK